MGCNSRENIVYMGAWTGYVAHAVNLIGLTYRISAIGLQLSIWDKPAHFKSLN